MTPEPGSDECLEIKKLEESSSLQTHQAVT